MELRTKAVREQGYGELNGNAGKRETPLRRLTSEDILSFSSPNHSNGRPQNVDVSCISKQAIQNGGTLLGRGIVKTKNVMQKSVLDKRHVKTCANKLDSIFVSKSDAAPISNGIVANNYACVPNGYAGVAEHNGSGSESGYNTPKKQKARLDRVDLGLLQDRVMQLEADTVNFTQDPVDLKPDILLEREGCLLSYTNSACKYESGGSTRGKAGTAAEQRKIPEGKPILCKKLEERPKCKQPVTLTSGVAQKDDSWTLFKPPPVFPVDNSSAKIVPRISYASKVKENLNKAIQTPSVSLCSSPLLPGDTPLQTTNRLTHVPMSAMKSVTSASFSNGPVLAGNDGTSYTASNQSLLASIASTALPHSSTASRDLSTAEQKSSLFVYPSSMQSLPMGLTQSDLSAQTNQHSLGEIFQNQWGLSFINEPSAGPESIDIPHPDKMDLPFDEDYAPNLLTHRDEKDPMGGELAVFPKAYELDKRTSPPILSSLLKSAVSNLGTVSHEPCHIGELQKAESMSQDVLVFLSKDYETDSVRASSTNALLASAKEQQYPGSLEKNHTCGTFNPSAAIVYHTREIESIWNLQKQDPKRIITYNDAMDHIAH